MSTSFEYLIYFTTILRPDEISKAILIVIIKRNILVKSNYCCFKSIYLKKLSKHCLNVTKETSKAEGMPFVKCISYLVSFKTEISKAVFRQ